MSRATYLYCLVRTQSGNPPPLDGVPPGLPGCAPPRLVGLAEAGDGLWLVVADAPLPGYDGDEIQRHLQDLSWVSERALAHEAVVEHFLAAGTVIPMKLFTLFAGDERAAAYVRGEGERLERVLARVDGCLEWGVQVRLDEARAREVVAVEARSGSGGQSAGKGFLLRKKLEQEGARTLAERLRSEAGEVFEGLAEQAAEAIRREPPSPEAARRMLLDGAFLVPRERSAAFESEVARAAERLAGRACELTLTGPWPPYNFLEEGR
ncbi:MAG TPA: GvpL/GvpF family gas vesicle protein [Thermoanaerobaculia bacterium]|nr:GvpL/GvpF family gas vesicle protein [Thermoanaerobaculia bacterium]